MIRGDSGQRKLTSCCFRAGKRWNVIGHAPLRVSELNGFIEQFYALVTIYPWKSGATPSASWIKLQTLRRIPKKIWCGPDCPLPAPPRLL
jgi:hypothetical protein